MWRVGTKVPINVYKNDVPVCQCQTPELAAEIVAGMNQTQTPSFETLNQLVALSQKIAAQRCIGIFNNASGYVTINDLIATIRKEFGLS